MVFSFFVTYKGGGQHIHEQQIKDNSEARAIISGNNHDHILGDGARARFLIKK
jgi:hypothetical protein